ncbi:unnamed protein product [Ilex paraguariensis]|uniref:Uncharacterized protein n=1 Tax=Ilex paraguariensis TaxID=185542 RepID=A0ABC8T031_9AQUA
MPSASDFIIKNKRGNNYSFGNKGNCLPPTHARGQGWGVKELPVSRQDGKGRVWKQCEVDRQCLRLKLKIPCKCLSRIPESNVGNQNFKALPEKGNGQFCNESFSRNRLVK